MFMRKMMVLAAVSAALVIVGQATPSSAQSGREAVAGLSDNPDCFAATTIGVVVSRSLKSRDREVEGFRFKDEFGTGYVNVELPDNMSRARRADVHKRLLTLLRPGRKLKVTVDGCGAAGRVQILSSATSL